MFWRGGMASGYWNRAGWFRRDPLMGQTDVLSKSASPTVMPSGMPQEAKDPDFVLPAVVAAGALGIAALVTVLSGTRL